MATNKSIRIKQYNGTDYDVLYPETIKAQITDFPTTMTPSSHTHGNITNDGKIGSTADLPVFTTTAGAVTTKSVVDTLTLLGAAQIATGSYTGTGTYGSGNPNSLTFSGIPKTLEIWSTFSSVYYGSSNDAISKILLAALPNNNTYYQVNVPSATSTNDRVLYVKKSADGKTVSWYSTASASQQCNNSAGTYTYLTHI